MILPEKYSHHGALSAATPSPRGGMFVIYRHVNASLLARLEKIEQGLVEQFSSCNAVENALLIGNSRQSRLLQSCHCQHRYLFCESYPNPNPQTSPICLGHFTALPYAKESIDLVILPHVLEFSNEPKEILKQIFDSLSKRGILLLFALSASNKLLLANKSSDFSPLSIYATKQLLTQVGLEIIATQSFFSPLSRAPETKFMQLINNIITSYLPFLCNAYLIVAQKTSIPTIPIPLKSFSTQTIAMALESPCRNQQESP